jgi:hypothetical protein
MIIAIMKEKTSYSREYSTINHIPKIKAIDYMGNIFDFIDLKGKISIIQFINTYDPLDIELMNNIYNYWKLKNLNIVFISNNIKEIIKVVENNINYNIRIIPNNILINKEFNIIKNGYYFIFNEAGNIIRYGRNGDNYDCKIKIILDKLINNEYYKIYELFDINESFYNSNIYGEISEELKKGKVDFCILSFFNKICNTCSGSRVLQMLCESFAKKRDHVKYYVILNDRYSKNDVDNLINNLEIKMPVIIASGKFGNKWNYLNNKYCEDEISDIIIVINKNGIIQKIADNKCNCYLGIFEFIDKL